MPWYSSLKPDIEGFPLLKSEKGRIFIEFQGYNDPFIRHRLMAQVVKRIK
jgi:hypothetical protein